MANMTLLSSLQTSSKARWVERTNLTKRFHKEILLLLLGRLCGLVIRVPGYRSKGPGFDSRHYQIFWITVGLERGPLGFLSTTEELFGRNSSGPSLESREYDHGDPLRWPRDTSYPQKLALTSPTCGGHSVGIVRSRTKAMEFDIITITRSSCPCA
jgi:hypothetical protein